MGDGITIPNRFNAWTLAASIVDTPNWKGKS